MLGRFFTALAIALALATGSAAQTTELVFAVTEGVTYQATPKEIRDRFAPLAEAIGRAVHRPVRTVVVPAYDDLRAGLAAQQFDVAFVHPAHVALAEIKTGRYRSIAWTTGFTDYTVSLMMPAKDPLGSMRDLRGRTLVTPDPDSITAVMVRAMVRDQQLSAGELKVITTRYQDAVPFYLEHGFAHVGATAAKSVVKGWTDKGGKVLTQSRGVPIKQFIASSRLPTYDQVRIQEALTGLASAKNGPSVLATVGYKGFVVPDPQVETATIAWLGL
jgi:phosphonate transport system substrate-binding protein